MDNNRDTIFISHATPADNEFSIWLASRLEMFGYKVWIDKNELLGGERFWPTIQKAIQRSQKVLLVYSKNIIDSEGILKRGIDDEISFAKDQAYQYKLEDFVIPLHIDNSGYGLAISMPNINHIPFYPDWAEGLSILLKKLEKDNIFPSEKPNSSFSKWYEQNYVSEICIERRKQIYYSTWLGFKHIPDHFYIYKFNTLEQAKEIRKLNDYFPINQQSNILTTFEPNLNLTIETENSLFSKEDLYPEIISVEINRVIDSEEVKNISKNFPSHKDKINALIRLLKSTWNYLLKNKGLFIYEMSGKRYAYYQPVFDSKHHYGYLKKQTKNNQNRRKYITGKYKENIWHYALSTRIMIKPILGYDLKSHIVFSKDGKDYIKDTKFQHRRRRSKGKNMFNEDWRDLLLAYLQNLKDKEGKIQCSVGYDNLYVELHDEPLKIKSEYDYLDPKTPMSEENIEGFLDLDEIYEDED